MTAAGPVLVYDRIAENRRRTRLLLVFFVLVLLPFGLGFIPLGIPFVEFGILLFVLGEQRFGQIVRSSPGALSLAAGLIVLAGVLATGSLVAVLQFRRSTRLVLRMAEARPVRREQEPQLWQVVENLCIGAGLLRPAIYVAETRAPNAFSAGLDPARACLVATRGLLQLLNRRELEGVVAHELSHIGNHDSRLSTLLTAILAMLRLPLDLLYRLGPVLATGCLVVSAVLFVMATVSAVGIVGEFVVALWIYPHEMAEFLRDVKLKEVMQFSSLFTSAMWFTGAPLYVLLGAQVCGFAARGAVSRQREFMADADAVLLTRDPEGLALALVKIAATSGIPVNVPAAAAHLYVVAPPRQAARWWDRTYASHPPIEERIAVLSRMGVGISPTARQAAEAAAVTFLAGEVDEPVRMSHGAEEAVTPHKPAPTATPPAALRDIDPTTLLTNAVSYLRLTKPTSLYEAPDAASAVLRQLSGGVVLGLLGVDGGFLLVETPDRSTGYIARSTSVSWEQS